MLIGLAPVGTGRDLKHVEDIMRATMVSTDAIVTIPGQHSLGRVWECVSDGGIEFTAYITLVQVRAKDDNSEFERELHEQHKRPGPATQRAIDMRFVI